MTRTSFEVRVFLGIILFCHWQHPHRLAEDACHTGRKCCHAILFCRCLVSKPDIDTAAAVDVGGTAFLILRLKKRRSQHHLAIIIAQKKLCFNDYHQLNNWGISVPPGPSWQAVLPQSAIFKLFESTPWEWLSFSFLSNAYRDNWRLQ